MLRAAGYTPACTARPAGCRAGCRRTSLTCRFGWPTTTRTPDPDFDGCASIEEVQTKWGRYMASLGDKLCGWQFGRIGCGGKYGVGSANVDRDWIYFQPTEDKEEKPMEWTKIEGRQLRCTSGEKPACEVFEASVVDARVVGRLELDEACGVLAQGAEVTLAGMEGTWYQIEHEGAAGCTALRCRPLRGGGQACPRAGAYPGRSSRPTYRQR